MTTGTMRTCGGTCSAMAIPMEPRCLAWLGGLIILNLATLVLADTTHPGIHVTILGIRNSTGAVACVLFESPE